MWKDSFDLGIPPMDLQHRKLVGMIETAKNLISDAQDGIDCYDEIAQVLEELKNYTIEHFKDEEALMDLKGYTDLERHREKHNAFVLKVQEFLSSDIDYNQTEVLVGIVQFLLDWVVEHILYEDKKYVAVMM